MSPPKTVYLIFQLISPFFVFGSPVTELIIQDMSQFHKVFIFESDIERIQEIRFDRRSPRKLIFTNEGNIHLGRVVRIFRNDHIRIIDIIQASQQNFILHQLKRYQ